LSRIDLNVVATGNFGQLEGQLARLKAQIAAINSSMSTTGMISPTAISNMQRYSDLMGEQLRSTGMFQTRMVSLTSETENFGRSLERGNIRLGEYFRTASGYIKNQQTEVQKLAREQVRLQNSMTLATGDGRAMVITPTGIDEAIHKQQILNQEYRIFRQVVAGGSTQLINWGKNTQWAGRQLTVGLTVPLTLFGAAAAKTFMEADKQLTRLVKVYGDASKGIVDPGELAAIRSQTLGLAKDIASSMGVAAEETLGIAADIASTGKQGNELLTATNEAMRLSVLGEVDRQEAMRATLSIQSVFKKDTEGLTESINFLNAVENQTSTTLNDLVTGIVKAGPVVQGLGGDIEDLSLMMVAMREGGVPASEAANAIKSSLASLINPTKQTTATLNEFGVDLISIVDKNAGDVIGTLVDLQDALAGLDELSRQRAIEQIFGKFQFSRINALLSNLGKAGSQTQQVLQLAGLSAGELAENADRELKAVTESVSGRFQRALASVQANLIPIGETFTEVGTLILNVASKILEIFNNLPGPVQTFLKGLMYLVGLAGPIIMITGVFGNFLGYLLKGVSSFMALKKAGRGIFEYFTPESVAAKNASELITQSIYDETTAVNMLTAAIEKLSQALNQMTGEALEGGTALSGMQAGTMAAAEANAAATSGRPILETAKTGHTYGAGELSHILAESKMSQYGFSDIERQLLLSPGTLLGAQDFSAKRFQSKMGANFAAEGYYDPSSMGSRQEALYKMSGDTPGSGKEFDLLIKSMDEQMMARLYPTMQEHTASVAKYQVSLEQLFKKSDSELENVMQQIKKAVSEGNMDEAARILRQNIDLTDDQLSAAITKKAQEYRSHFDEVLAKTGSRKIATEETAALMAGTEKEMLATAPERGGFAQTGSRMKRQGSAMAIMALSGDLPMSEELTAASSRRVKALNALAAAEENLKNQGDQLQRLNREEVLAARTKLKDLDMEHAFAIKNAKGAQEIYVKEQGLWKRVYANGVKKELTDAKLIAQLEQRVVAEKRVTLATRYVEEADKKEALASQQAAQADIEEAKQSRNAAKSDMAEVAAGAGLTAQGRGRGGKMAMMGGGALSALGMATMFLPTGEPGSTTEQATSVVGGVATGAGMGAMVGSVFPGIGTAIGAAVGGVIGGIGPVLSIFSDNAAKAAAEVDRLRLSAEIAAGAVSDLEKDFLGLDVKELEDLPFQVFGERTDEASSQLEQFTQALIAATAAEEGSIEKQRVEEIKQFASGAELVNSSMFMEMIGQAIISGTDPDQLKLMFQAYLDVADKQIFATAVNNAIDSFMPDGASIQSMRKNFIKKTSESLNAMISDVKGGGDVKNPAAAARLIAEESALDKLRAGGAAKIGDKDVNVIDIVKRTMEQDPIMREMIMRGGQAVRDFGGMAPAGSEAAIAQFNALQGTGLANLTIDGQLVDEGTMLSMLSSITTILEMSPDINELTSDVTKLQQASNAMAGAIADSLATLSGAEFAQVIKSLDPAIFEKDSATLNEFIAQLSAIPEIGPDIANAFQTMINNGADVTTAFKALKLMTAGTNMTIEEIISLTSGPPREFNIVYRETFVQDGAPVGPAVLPRPTEGASMPSNALSSAISAMGGISTGGGSGGGESDTSAIEEAYDKQIEKQDKLIEKIQEEREERQKLLDLEKQAFDFAMKEQDLKNQIARARAEGRTAEAAMLQAQLDNARANNKEQETERARRESEDRRIERAEKRKEELARAKEIALEEARGGAAGGGGAEGISQEVADAMKVAMMELTSWTQSKAFKDMATETGPMSAFFDSKKVKGFRTELEKLNVPTQVINDILDSMFDSFVSNNEVYAEGLEITRANLEKVGLAGEDLEDALPNVYGIMIDKGLSAQEKLALIAKEYENVGYGAEEAKKKALEFYDVSSENVNLQRIKDIAAAYGEVAGKARAAAMQTAVLNIVTNNPNVSVEDAAASVALDFAKFGAATGGYILGPGTSTSDSIPVRLSNGEYVVRASMVDKYGVPLLEAINKGMLPSMATGGMISRYPSVAARMAGGGYVYRGMAAGGLVNGTSAEYNINVNVETNASADDIANKVMQSLQRRDKMNRAGIRI
jgi:TP901 family phage tail tape measure protein